MNECLYGKLNSETIKKEYIGTIEAIEENKVGTADIAVDNVKNTLKVQVNKTPGTLKITKSVNADEKKTLVEFDGSESKEINLDEVDAYTGIENETSKTTVDTEHNTIDVEVKRTPGKIKFEKGGKILTDHLGEEVAFDGSEDTTLHIPSCLSTSFSPTETFEAVYNEETDKITGNVLKVPHTLTIVDENTGTQQMFDGGEGFGDVTITIPESEKGIPQLVGTLEKPINIYNDTKVGQVYSVTGYVVFLSPTSPSNLSDYNYLFFRESTGRAICFNRGDSGHGLSIIEYYVGPTYMSSGDYGTVVKLNGVIYETVQNIYVPITSGTTGQILKSNGASNAPTWITPNYATQDDITNAIGNVSALLGNTDDLEV